MNKYKFINSIDFFTQLLYIRIIRQPNQSLSVQQERNFQENGFVNFEKKFIESLSIVAIIIAIFGVLINLFLGFTFSLILVPLSTTFIFLATYAWAKNGKKHLLLKVLTTTVTFILSNFLWFYNYGSHGPAPYFFIICFSLLIFIWKGRALITVTTLLFTNIAIVFLIEFLNPNMILPYESNTARIIDSYTGTLMYGTFIFVLLRNAKNYLLTEYQKAIESDQLKTAFLENMSHEVRTPLNAIIGFSSMIAQGDLPLDQKEKFTKIIESNNNLLLHTIDDILDMSKIESNTFLIIPKETNLNSLVEGIKSTFDQTLKDSNKNLALKLILPEEIYTTTIDTTRLNQVLFNLIDNAIKFTDEGVILVKMNYYSDYFKFSVQDTGIGIEEKNLKLIFDRFYKGNKSTNELYRGTGVGLYLSSQIVKMLGGELAVESSVGMGSTFHFTIPCIETNVSIPNYIEEDGEPVLLKQDKEPLISEILIVEDNLSNLALLETLISKWEYTYHTAMTGENAIEIVKKNKNIKLVLLDINLPGISGIETFSELKKINPNLTIIAQTAYAMKEDEMRCKELGFNTFLRKPIESEVLKHHLRHFLRSKV